MAALEAKRRMKGLLMFLPNMVALCGRLMVDPRVPRTDRALVAGAVIYALIPFDFLPDMIPFVGQVDDVYLISLTLLRLMNRSDEEIVRQHWHGGGDVVNLINSAASIAPMILPKRIRRVLESRVEIKPKGKTATVAALAGAEPVLVEIADESG